MDKFNITPVGYVRSDVTGRSQAPRQGPDTSVDASIEILTPYADALNGIGQWSQLLVICWMHLADRDILNVHPRGNTNAPLTGVFSTRSPARPNPLAVYTVDLLSVDGYVLYVKGIDAIDGTPVLDIKPYIPRLDD
jgi:tRNA-Thr(GGU) m(6)t(6)A37 methyltransferase TsaA